MRLAACSRLHKQTKIIDANLADDRRQKKSKCCVPINRKNQNFTTGRRSKKLDIIFLSDISGDIGAMDALTKEDEKNRAEGEHEGWPRPPATATATATATPRRRKPVADKQGANKPPAAAKSHPVMVRRVTLRTEAAQVISRAHLEKTIRNLYAIAVVMRIVFASRPEQLAQAGVLMEGLVGRLQELNESLSGVKERYSATFNASLPQEPSYTKVFEEEIQITSPQAMSFLNLLDEFDRLCVKIDALWFAGLVTDDEKAQVVRQFHRPIRQFARECAIVAVSIWAKAKESGTESMEAVRGAAEEETGATLGQLEPVAPSTAEEVDDED